MSKEEEKHDVGDTKVKPTSPKPGTGIDEDLTVDTTTGSPKQVEDGTKDETMEKDEDSTHKQNPSATASSTKPPFVSDERGGGLDSLIGEDTSPIFGLSDKTFDSFDAGLTLPPPGIIKDDAQLQEERKEEQLRSDYLRRTGWTESYDPKSQSKFKTPTKGKPEGITSIAIIQQDDDDDELSLNTAGSEGSRIRRIGEFFSARKGAKERSPIRSRRLGRRKRSKQLDPTPRH